MAPTLSRLDVAIRRLDVHTCTIPTDFPEADGTHAWDSTTIVIVTAEAGGTRGIGYSYADVATARLVHDLLVPAVTGFDAMALPAAWAVMVRAIRNLGRPGIASMAIAAVDNALWDLKARLLDVPLVTLIGQARDRIDIYGSGGFTSYAIAQLQQQLADWVARGIPRVKMKIGSRPEADLSRVEAARQAIGPAAELFVDANGAYQRKFALAQARRFAEFGVTWFEEPVPSDDLEGLRLLRDRAPAGMRIAAGEYGYDAPYFDRMLGAGAVDVLQADATRCAGITGFLQAAALCHARAVPLSAHTAPSLHAHVCCAAAPAINLEYFHDHARIEQLLFDGVLQPVDGALKPDLSRPGNGLTLKEKEIERFRVV